MLVYNQLKRFMTETTGGRNVFIRALHVDVP